MPTRTPHRRFLVVAMAILGLTAGWRAARADAPMPLAAVRTYLVQIQNLEKSGAVDALADSPYDMLVIDTAATAKGGRWVDMRKILARLRAKKPARIILAYCDVGAAESDRTYWQDDWREPTADRTGRPTFLLAPNVGNWPDTFPVAYWDPRWQQIIAGGPDAVVARTLTVGFDGLWLDNVDVHADPRVAAAASTKGIDPARAMVDWIARIRHAAREVNPNALLVAQGGLRLLDADPQFADHIDGLCGEGTWFGGHGDVPWNSPEGGDVPNTRTGPDSLDARLAALEKFAHLGKPVFTLDYCIEASNARRATAESRARGYVPLVTRSSLGGQP